MNVGDRVTFNQGDDSNTQLTGTVTRVWPNGRYVTIKTDGKTRTFVRDINNVHKI